VINQNNYTQRIRHRSHRYKVKGKQDRKKISMPAIPLDEEQQEQFKQEIFKKWIVVIIEKRASSLLLYLQ
jgi:hypothetical protein